MLRILGTTDNCWVGFFYVDRCHLKLKLLRVLKIDLLDLRILKAAMNIHVIGKVRYLIVQYVEQCFNDISQKRAPL